jgi:hypothetical protein
MLSRPQKTVCASSLEVPLAVEELVYHSLPAPGFISKESRTDSEIPDIYIVNAMPTSHD